MLQQIQKQHDRRAFRARQSAGDLIAGKLRGWRLFGRPQANSADKNQRFGRCWERYRRNRRLR